MGSQNGFKLGSLYPRLANGEPNLILASDLKLKQNGKHEKVYKNGKTGKRSLRADLEITTEPVIIPGAENYINSFYLPQLTAKSNKQSIFTGVLNSVTGSWTSQARNKSIASLLEIGYKGPGAEHAATNNAYWNAYGSKDDDYWNAINSLNNYAPSQLWLNYASSQQVQSRFDSDALLQHLDPTNKNPDLWYPSLLYTYGTAKQGTSYPAPVLMIEPGTEIKLNFQNKLAIAGLSQEQAQKATLVPVSTYGNSASDGLGGSTSLNFHLHGSHTTPAGFGDNVVARYTTGQRWTTEIDIPADHGQGSYWYHPHYHPSVNQQVYGGLSGFMQIGDPLSKIPDFKNLPRNLAVLKAMDLEVDPNSGELLLGSNANLGGVANRMTMVTVNGEFQPSVDAGEGGWQALTLSNQSNQAYYNISLINTSASGEKSTLPIYVYGEDGHQYPEIRPAIGTLGNQSSEKGNNPPGGYSQADNLISLPPGKRVDILFKLPKGSTELASLYSFENTDGIDYNIANMGAYPDLSNENQGLQTSNSGAGPLALFQVSNGKKPQSQAELNREIHKANKGIQVQKIKPTTLQSDYDITKVPSVNLFSEKNGKEEWKPIRKREFSWTKGTLVGPEDEWDAPTQELLESYSENNEGASYERYTSLPVGSKGVDSWLGYENPFLINDHVFPNAPLIITQLGTMEEWDLLNWSINSPSKYIGHPFHIHINDYQVKDSDTELDKKRNLEDVTMLNSSGYDYVDDTGKRFSQAPLKGEFIGIPEALRKGAYNPLGGNTLATWGANSQTVRMLFQDYLGTYVFHCHILPHEDAGMMQVLTVVENTDSSWLAASEGFQQSEQGIELMLAQDFSSRLLKARQRTGETWERIQVGDLSNDFVQDVVLSSSGSNGGTVQIFDGSKLLHNRTHLQSALKPYKQSTLAPWAFAEDFSGDGKKDLVTVGLNRGKQDNVNLDELRLKAWSSTSRGRSWKQQFSFDPFDSIQASGTHGEHSLSAKQGLNADQVSVAMADMNLDNFQDVVFGYATKEGLRIVVLDGAALTLQYQTGTVEGGYFPDSNVLADALLIDSSLSDLSQVVLNAGFNSYAQSAIENVVITTQSSAGTQQFTIQLNAGHFIATSEPGMEGDTEGGESHHSGSGSASDQIFNLRHDSMPIQLVEQLALPDDVDAVTPVIAGSRGIGATIVGDRLVVAQGNGANGNSSTGNALVNTSQQLVLDSNDLLKVSRDDLTGIVTSNLNSTFSAGQLRERNQLTALTYQAYAGGPLWPSGQAGLAAAVLGQGLTAAELAETLLTQPGYSSDVEHYYGGSLSDLSVDVIVNGATRSLYQRQATGSELRFWKGQVQDGLGQTLLPLAILQSTSGKDRYRLGLLSAAAAWTQMQWGTTANIAGSFGQGLQADPGRANKLDQQLAAIGRLDSWRDAQQAFNAYTDSALNQLDGTPVSKSGFF